MSNLTTLLYCPEMETMARQIASQYPDSVRLGEVVWGTFADGFPNNFVKNAHMLDEVDVAFLASFDSPASIFNQLSVLYALPSYNNRSLQVFLPFFPVGTMDRADELGGIVTAKTLARMLSAIPSCLERKTEIIIFDLHSAHVRHFFGDGVAVNLRSCARFFPVSPSEEVVIVFPDKGAFKRYGSKFPGFSKVICDKDRVEAQRLLAITSGCDGLGLDRLSACIVDDLIQSGETILACQRVLKTAGIKHVSVFAPHGVMPNEAWRKLTPEDFDHVWITDSCPATARAVEDIEPFEVLPLSSLIFHMMEKKS